MLGESTLGKDIDATNSLKQQTYSDASSSYWPPGWNFERFTRGDVADIATLSEEEKLKLQAGLRDVLGEDGVGKLSQYLWELEKTRPAEAKGQDTTKLTRELGLPPPNWLRYCKQYYTDQPWGFVVFRTASYDDEPQWEKFKAEVTRIIRIPFRYEEQYDPISEGFEIARANFKLHWIEDRTLAGASQTQLLAKYKDLRNTLPAGLAGKIFLCASPNTILSVLSTDETEHPTTISSSKRWQSTAPYLLAIIADPPGLEDDHDEWRYYKPVFKAGIETLIDELWWLADSDIMETQRITRTVKTADELGPSGGVSHEDLEEIWWSTAPSPARKKRRRRW